MLTLTVFQILAFLSSFPAAFFDLSPSLTAKSSVQVHGNHSLYQCIFELLCAISILSAVSPLHLHLFGLSTS